MPSPRACCWALSSSGPWGGLWTSSKNQLKHARPQVLFPGSELVRKPRCSVALVTCPVSPMPRLTSGLVDTILPSLPVRPTYFPSCL